MLLSRTDEISFSMNRKSICQRLAYDIFNQKHLSFDYVHSIIKMSFGAGYDFDRVQQSNKKKSVCCISIVDNTIIYIFDSISEAARYTYSDGRNISAVCKNKRKNRRRKVNGYNWRFTKMNDFVGKKVKT